jgi:uncharacterized membrane protein YjgN (DUF898 family)
MNETNTMNPFSFQGRGGEFFKIWIVNILLSIVTLGIYSAWAKVRTKRYFYGNSFLASDNFEYHGQPMQILRGRIVAVVCLVVWGVSSSVSPIFSAILLLVFYALLPRLLWSNARFDAAMTSYRNTHFSFAGSLKKAYRILLGRSILALLAFVVALSVFAVMVRSMASGWAIGVYAIFVLLLLVSIQAWIMSGMWNYFINGYRYGDYAFSATLSFQKFMRIYLIGAVIFVVGVLLIGISLFSTIMSMFYGFNSMAYGGFNPSIFFSIAGIYLAFILLGVIVSVYVAVKTRNYMFAEMFLACDKQAECFGFQSTFTVGTFLILIITNVLATVCSLGLARPWVKVRVARYIAAHTQVRGDLSSIAAVDQNVQVRSAVGDELAQAFDLDLGIG